MTEMSLYVSDILKFVCLLKCKKVSLFVEVQIHLLNVLEINKIGFNKTKIYPTYVT